MSPIPLSRIRVRSARILVVEDDVSSAECLAEVLAAEGHAVAVALDAYEALASVEDFTPDVAIIDIGLPRVSGIQVAAALRTIARLSDCRYVALTGYTGEDIARAIAAARFDVHMTKPMNVERLLSIVANTARERRAG